MNIKYLISNISLRRISYVTVGTSIIAYGLLRPHKSIIIFDMDHTLVHCKPTFINFLSNSMSKSFDKYNLPLVGCNGVSSNKLIGLCL